LVDDLTALLVILYAYFVGAVPVAYWTARWLRGVDIRNFGSGNLGGSNVAASIGKRYAIPVIFVDMLVKGAATMLIARALGLEHGYQGIVGFAAVVGHGWSIYIRFIGGRGVATATGVLLVLVPREVMICGSIFLSGVILSRNSAAWVGVAMALVPFTALLFGEPLKVVLSCVALVSLLALKRLEANRRPAPAEIPPILLFIRRLIFDRDVGNNEEWIHRRNLGS